MDLWNPKRIWAKQFFFASKYKKKLLRVARNPIEAANIIGLEVFTVNTKIIELIESRGDSNEMLGINHANDSGFKYLGTTLSTMNGWSSEISIKTIKSQNALYSLPNSQHLKCNLENRQYNTIWSFIRPNIINGCLSRNATKQTETFSRTFGHRVWRITKSKNINTASWYIGTPARLVATEFSRQRNVYVDRFSAVIVWLDSVYHSIVYGYRFDRGNALGTKRVFWN